MYEYLNERRRQGVELGTRLINGFEMMTKSPMAVQTKFLMDLLQENKDTARVLQAGIWVGRGRAPADPRGPG